MVRPCSCPTGEWCWDGARVKRSTAMANKSIATIGTMGIDIGKNSFHVVGLDRRGAIVLRQKWSRGQIEARIANIPPCLIGMEACVGAHHLSRKLQAHGHDARLMPAKYVRAYSKGQKNDFRDGPVRFSLDELHNAKASRRPSGEDRSGSDSAVVLNCRVRQLIPR